MHSQLKFQLCALYALNCPSCLIMAATRGSTWISSQWRICCEKKEPWLLLRHLYSVHSTSCRRWNTVFLGVIYYKFVLIFVICRKLRGCRCCMIPLPYIDGSGWMFDWYWWTGFIVTLTNSLINQGQRLTDLGEESVIVETCLHSFSSPCWVHHRRLIFSLWKREKDDVC